MTGRLRVVADRTLYRVTGSADLNPMLACINCARPIVFAVNGWVHRDPDNECRHLHVAWPPPGAAREDDEETPERAAS